MAALLGHSFAALPNDWLANQRWHIDRMEKRFAVLIAMKSVFSLGRSVLNGSLYGSYLVLSRRKTSATNEGYHFCRCIYTIISILFVERMKNVASEPSAGNRGIKLVFICTGNICRSPTADGVFRRKGRTLGLPSTSQLIRQARTTITRVLRLIHVRSQRRCGGRLISRCSAHGR